MPGRESKHSDINSLHFLQKVVYIDFQTVGLDILQSNN
jgi:hypothetical protein